MEIDELRRRARRYIERIQASNSEPISLPQWSLSQDVQSTSLASLIEKLDIDHKKKDRAQLFEKFVVLNIYLAGKEDIGCDDDDSDRDAATELCSRVANATLPSEAFAERSLYSIEETQVLASHTIAQEHALSLQGLNLLSHLLKLVPLKTDESTITTFTCLASFSDESDPWTSSQIQEQARALTEEYLSPERTPALLHRLLQERVKPLFARSKNPAITQQGRKVIDPLPGNDTAHSDLDTETKPWKYRDVFIVTVFRWILTRLDKTSLETNWPLIIPPLLALIDDTSTAYKAKGCDSLRIFLQKCPSQILERTGLGEVFDNAVTPCLMYLPSLTEETESLQLLNAAYPALFELARVRHADERQRAARSRAFDSILRSGVLIGYAHAGEHVKIAEVLVQQMTFLINEMGIASAKHLKHIIPLISANLAAPFATAYPPLLQVSVQAMEAVIVNDWPRISYYRGEILRGLTICWCRIKDKEIISRELAEVQISVQRVSKLLTFVLREEIDVADEYRILIDSDDQLRDLLVV